VRDYLRLALSDREHEVFVCIWLDAQHRAIALEEAARGTLTQTSVYPREIMKSALRNNAAAVIFAHNHPSGVAQPSQSDQLLTPESQGSPGAHRGARARPLRGRRRVGDFLCRTRAAVARSLLPTDNGVDPELGEVFGEVDPLED
jgi:hypothetical protein